MSRSYFAHLAPLVTVAALAALAVGGAAPAQGASFTVDATHDAVDASPGDGVCADTGGACTLRAAVMETNALAGADEISLPAGTYVLSIPGVDEDNGASGDLDIADDLGISAPLVVNGAAEPSAIIDGADLDRVLDVRGTTSLTLQGTIIQGGAAVGSPSFGGGVRNNSGELTVRDSVIRANSATAFGGGIFSGANSTTSVERSTISGNSASEGGGVFTVSGSDVSLEFGLIDGNSAVLSGGGIANGGFATLRVFFMRITGNSAANGGGLANFGTAEVAATTISGNSTEAPGGAGLQAGGGSLVLTNSTIAENQGIGFVNGGSPPSEPVPNTVADLLNVTISGNQAGVANGSTGELRATNLTAAFNTGIGILNVAQGTVTLVNTIIAFNHPGGDCFGPITSAGHNANVDGTCALAGPGDFPHAEMAVLPLADNGGPTLTHALPRLDRRTDVVVRNDAIDGGDAASCPPTDQRGELRPFDGDGDQVPECDIGAFELRESPLVCEPSPCGVQFVTPSPTPVSSPDPTPAVTPRTLPATGGDAGPAKAMPLAFAVAAIVVAGGGARLLRRRRR